VTEGHVFDDPAVERLIATAVEEDLGRGDITSEAVVAAGRRGLGVVQAKSALVVAGTPLIARVYERIATVEVTYRSAEGAAVQPGAVLAEVRGEARALLAGERTVLNLLQHLSGIATLTRRCVQAIEGLDCAIRDTRKTLPGLRLLEKYAVRVGGGTNHRMRLDDGVLIKDNHVALAGGVGAAVAAAKRALPAHEIEVECDTLSEVEEALGAGADVILFDNMTPAAIARAVRLVGDRARMEASGGITPERIREIAALGVHYIAMGCLTHSAPAADVSIAIAPLEPERAR